MKSHMQPVQADVMENKMSMATFATTVDYSQPVLHAVVEVVEETDEEDGSSEEEQGEESGSEEGEVKDEEWSNREAKDEERTLHGHQQKLCFPEHV